MLVIGIKVESNDALVISDDIFWQQPDDETQREYVERMLNAKSDMGFDQYLIVMNDEVVDHWNAGEEFPIENEE